MTFISIIAIALVIGFLLFAAAKKKKSLVVGKQYKAKPLLTKNEQEFTTRLNAALPGYHVFTQVAMGALLQPEVSYRDNKKEFYRVRGTFAQKIVDYVICDKEYNVKVIVELDDKTHDDGNDAKRDSMLAEAGYKIIRWHSKNKPSIEQIQAQIVEITQDCQVMGNADL